MADEQPIDLNALKAQRHSASRSSTSATTGSLVDKTVTFINAKGRMFTSEMNLPDDTSMEVIRSIGQTVLHSIDPKSGGARTKDMLVVLVEPNENLCLADVKRIVVFDREKLDEVLKR
jgi:hypothetical protein